MVAMSTIAPAPALDNTEVALAVDSRTWRYRLREAARSVSRGYAVAGCGTPLGHGVALQVLQDGSGGLGGIETCSSVWACPVCSARIGMGRRAELVRLVEWARAENLHVSFLTLTQRHTAGDSLPALWDRISKAWARLTPRKSWISMKGQVGWRGYVRAMEVTHGRHGWHVHAHFLILTERPLEGLIEVRMGRRVEHEDVHRFIGRSWEELIRRQGGDVVAGAGVDLRAVTGGTEDIVARYVGKSGSDIGLEMAMGAHKRGRRDSRTPFQVLADLEAFDTLRDREIWREWLAGSKGRLQLVWSRGLKDAAGISEMTDEEVSEQGGERDTLGFISRDDYVRVLESGLVPDLLEIIESGDIGGIIGTLGSRRSQ